MDIQARKLHFIQEFLRVTDEELVSKLEKFLQVERKKLLNKEVHPLSINEFNEIIDNSEDDFNSGKISTAQNILTQIVTWK